MTAEPKLEIRLNRENHQGESPNVSNSLDRGSRHLCDDRRTD